MHPKVVRSWRGESKSELRLRLGHGLPSRPGRGIWLANRPMKLSLSYRSGPTPGLVRPTILLTLWVLAAAAEAASGAAEKVDFNFHIRPLLSDRCFKCHGPDEKSRKAKLRLDSVEGARARFDDATQRMAFVPGSLERSEGWRRIVTPDLDDLMPPPASNLSLNQEEIELIRRWIEQGAVYETKWWSFASVKAPAVPAAPPGSEAPHPIDRFVLDRLQKEGLPSAPEASPETSIRRVALSLTGLPPSLAEIDGYLADEAPGAYERMVDRYLGSPHYGEHLAREWLDLARYADTYGYQADVDCDLSPWRDWVIRAFNENLSYRDFIRWQIAGDLLPGATRDQVVATAFNRLHRQTNEGGSIEEEFRAEYVADRVNTLGTAILGLSLECARCHDHKYDPITQKDYYSLSGFFNSIDESGLYSHFTRATPTPVQLLWEGDQEARQQELKARIAAAEKALAAARQAAETRAPGQTAQVPPPVARFDFEEIAGNRSPSAQGTNIVAELHDAPQLVPGHDGLHAIRFSGDNSVTIKGAGVFKRTDPFSFSLWLKPAEKLPRAVIFHMSRAWTDSGSRGYELVLDEGRPFFGLIHFWPGNAIGVRARDAVPTNAWSHLVVTYDGSSRADGVKLYLNGAPLALEVIRDHLYKDILHKSEWGDGEVGGVPLTLAGRFRDSGFKGGSIDQFQVFNVELAPWEAAMLGGVMFKASGFVRYHEDEACRAAQAELQKWRDAENDLVTPVREIMVMKEMPQPRETHLLRRGNYAMVGERVERSTPASLPPLPAGRPADRLALADWLTDRNHPLTARVEVNRIWKMHFGRGLVATPEDFGSQGRPPTHPELFEWLTAWFMDHGWDLKGLHRLILTSATFRQSSEPTAAVLARDPENLLYARGPHHRLAAEAIRDSALAVSGLLQRKIGGPSVKPYQPAGLWEESGTGKSYRQDHGDKLYRRSLYTFWRRTAPPPSMLTFDATSREVCTAKRETTATPLQALVLLNDPQFLEAARVLGEQLLREFPNSLDDRIRRAFRVATGRTPQPRELEILRQLHAEQLAHFQGQPEDALKYLAIGEAKRDESLPPDQLAATALVAAAVMNHDEFVMKR